jgi:hypothetical protein
MRQMCAECPFRPEYGRREAWVDMCQQIAKKQAFDEGAAVEPLHGCHMIEDAIPCKPENICLGYLDWVNGIRH